jgi:hypothetical protein
MRSGDALLQDLNARLQLPARARSNVLHEVRDDLDDMVEALVGQGMSREAAEQRAVLLICPGDDAVEELAVIHLSPYGHLSMRLGERVALSMERAAALAMAGLAAAAPVPALILGGLLPIWAALPLLVLAGVMAALLTRETFRWWVRREQDVRALAHAAVVQGATVGLALSWGAFATATEVYLAAAMWEAVAPAPEALMALVSQVMTLLALTLGVSMLGVFGSLALMQALWQARNLEGELAELLHSSHSKE